MQRLCSRLSPSNFPSLKPEAGFGAGCHSHCRLLTAKSPAGWAAVNRVRYFFPLILFCSVSSCSSNHEGLAENLIGENSCHPNLTLLVTETLVSTTPGDGTGPSNASTSQEGFTTARSLAPSQSGEIAVDGIALELARLQSKGLSDEMIRTLLKARKSKNATYSRIWEKFVSFTSQRDFSPLTPRILNILQFLQSALDIVLAYNSKCKCPQTSPW